MSIRIIIAGASGKMGQEAVKLIQRVADFQLVGAVSRTEEGKDVGEVVGIGSLGVSFHRSVATALDEVEADVLIDFTSPECVKDHMELCLQAGVRPVVGTTGLSEEEIDQLQQDFSQKKLGALIIPNFAIGAVLMMVFAAKAAKYLPHVEIIESHHDHKLDAPSGTSLKTAELIAEARKEVKQGHPSEQEVWEGARGAYYSGFRIHSVRLPGLVAHQEVLFGGDGQLLTIRHDSLNRESFMPGVDLSVRKVMNLDHLVYGLEKILDM
ncbi:4-hydroxy-tetrahydrodipicolinate reductase [Thermoactinomyces sp. DSM 45892]|uniref:4-hydroxy-tetrahydrodipicolinate reductase n=1 Tax=Thermoactinomyces sp. DSM 45892 TaxID=1882753 RepID=UPI00089613A1|nr:4-hydroxy-tetrahydrodipicolinate reductase [Thermoactinomyces sp. DSM 45892]SDY98160.1 dihydrodipicolinate reductase [Thermoactinomyces sp. DSM 45892]